MSNENHHKAIVVGSGPAGLTAALYLARANLDPLVIEGFEAGGQLMLTSEVENYPGFSDGIMGPDLMTTFRKQAERFGAQYITDDATDVAVSSRPFRITVAGDEYTAEAVIVSTGASAKMLGLENERRLLGRGVSTCATCDGAFFRERRLIVVGGGDSAMEEALFLTRFASSVTVVHRREELRASKIMQERALANSKINFIWNSGIEEILGDTTVTGVRIKNLLNGESTEMPIDGVFVAIGHTPNTKLFENKLELDDAGYLVVGSRLSSDFDPVSPFATRTSVEGVFGAGDVVDHVYRQAVTAAGMGCMAAIDTERWLEAQGH
ncbi:MAG TPA: thioredoxin-disulfide reductase [Actinomycetota bacterium]|nr:thioredoxin-disulfide reductase [Actinomycetota bacterium]